VALDLAISAGPWLYPLVALAGAMVLAIGRAALVINQLDSGSSRLAPPHHAVLAWGVLSVVVGLLGTVIGLGRLAAGVRTSGGDRAELEQMMALMLDGMHVVMSPLAIGLSLLTISLVAWLALDFMVSRKLR